MGQAGPSEAAGEVEMRTRWLCNQSSCLPASQPSGWWIQPSHLGLCEPWDNRSNLVLTTPSGSKWDMHPLPAFPLCPGSGLPHGTRQTAWVTCEIKILPQWPGASLHGSHWCYHCPSGPTMGSQAHPANPEQQSGEGEAAVKQSLMFLLNLAL